MSSQPSEFSYFNRMWVADYPADNVMPLGAVAGMTEMLGFVSGSIGGQSHTKIDDTAQDTPHATKENYPGLGEAMDITATFKFNVQSFSLLLKCLPGPYRVAPAMGRVLVQGAMPNGVMFRTFAHVNMPKLADVPLDGKMSTDIEIVGSGKPVFYIPGQPLAVPPGQPPAAQQTTETTMTGGTLPVP